MSSRRQGTILFRSFSTAKTANATIHHGDVSQSLASIGTAELYDRNKRTEKEIDRLEESLENADRNTDCVEMISLFLNTIDADPRTFSPLQIGQYNRLIAQCSKIGGKLDRPAHLALKIYSRILSRGLKPNLITYSSMFTAVIRSKTVARVEHIWKDMLASGIKVNSIACNSAINSCVRTKNYSLGMRVFEYMKLNQIPRTIETYTSLLHLARLHSDPQEARNLITTSLESDRSGMIQESEFYSLMLRYYTESGKKDKFLELASQILQPRHYHNVPQLSEEQYYALMRGFADFGELERGISLLWKMRQNRIPISIGIVENLFRLFSKRRASRISIHYLQELLQEGYPLTCVIYNLVLSTTIATKDKQNFIVARDLLLSSGLVPDDYTMCTLMKACIEFDLFEEGMEIYQHALAILPRSQLKEYIFNVALNLCKSKLDLDRARQIIHDMVTHEVAPTLVTYNTLLCIVCAREDQESILQVLEEMESTNVNPNPSTLSILLRNSTSHEQTRFWKDWFYSKRAGSTQPQSNDDPPS